MSGCIPRIEDLGARYALGQPEAIARHGCAENVEKGGQNDNKSENGRAAGAIDSGSISPGHVRISFGIVRNGAEPVPVPHWGFGRRRVGPRSDPVDIRRFRHISGSMGSGLEVCE